MIEERLLEIIAKIFENISELQDKQKKSNEEIRIVNQRLDDLNKFFDSLTDNQDNLLVQSLAIMKL